MSLKLYVKNLNNKKCRKNIKKWYKLKNKDDIIDL
ncbi:hypothetical protein BD780_003001 [Clostridium tetanomorphum]|nr:hypothetical protein [Clostridium tetanomorphum]NRS85776.1 hypothetical protein [Clostridium tetanomorphum]NRZ96215.1 hypothetical protein [Clostridium tetanomorphum]SQC02495.1 Uncharacterised protein [Clostridium tetanomorphum]